MTEHGNTFGGNLKKKVIKCNMAGMARRDKITTILLKVAKRIWDGSPVSEHTSHLKDWEKGTTMKLYYKWY